MTHTLQGDGAGDDEANFAPRLDGDQVTRVRRQAAVARSVLAELERALAAGTTAVDEQLADELRRLGAMLLEVVPPEVQTRVSAVPRSGPVLVRSARPVEMPMPLRTRGMRS